MLNNSFLTQRTQSHAKFLIEVPLYFALLCVLCVLNFYPSPAAAARFSGAYLIQLCDMDEKGREKIKGGHTACQAYIGGVIDYHNVLQSMKIAPRVDICIPEKASSAHLHALVLKYLKRNPQHDNFIAAPAVTMALYEVYPCRRKK